MSEISGGTTIELRAPLVTSGVASVSETSERTAMSPDEPAEAPAASKLELPRTVPPAGPTDPTRPVAPPTTADTPDAKPTSMRT
jgi:hypothetical protein